MDRNYIDQNGIYLKYLRDELSDAELEEFEIYMLDNPEIIEELKLEEVMDTGLKTADWTVAQGTSKSRFKQILSLIFVDPWPRAFTAFFIGGIATYLFLPFSPNGPSANSVQLVYLSQYRGAEQLESPQSIVSQHDPNSNSARGHQIVLAVETGLEGGQLWTATLKKRPSTGTAQELGIFESDQFGVIMISLDASLLEPSDYLLELTVKGASKTQQRYSFDIEDFRSTE